MSRRSGAAAAAHPAADAVAGGVCGGPGALAAAAAARRLRAAHARVAPRHRHAAAAGLLSLPAEENPGYLVLLLIACFLLVHSYRACVSS